MLWQVIVNKGVTPPQLQEVLEQYGADVMGLKPTTVTRTEMRNGLLCCRDEESCIYAEGPPDLPDLLKSEPLVNAVLSR